MDWKTAFEEGKELLLSTSSKEGSPNANIVISLGFTDDKLLIADCQMKTTLDNLQKTKKACIVTRDMNDYYRIKGPAEVFTEGKYFDICSQKNEGPKIKHAIAVAVEEVFDLDSVKKIL